MSDFSELLKRIMDFLRLAQESELYELLRQLEAQPVVARGCVQVAQVLSHSAHAAVNAHSVVV